MSWQKDVKRRKKVSEAERLASDLSKIALELNRSMKHEKKANIQFLENKLAFRESKACAMDACTCKWSDPKRHLSYCSSAEFRFEACLPDRDYLTRYSVSCPCCFSSGEHAFHLYCSYCDEILTGSIAGPGGKISDHVVTIRHVVKESKALAKHFDQDGGIPAEYCSKAQEYMNILEQWSGTIRFKKNSDERQEIENVFTTLRKLLADQGYDQKSVPKTSPGDSEHSDGASSEAENASQLHAASPRPPTSQATPQHPHYAQGIQALVQQYLLTNMGRASHPTDAIASIAPSSHPAFPASHQHHNPDADAQQQLLAEALRNNKRHMDEESMFSWQFEMDRRQRHIAAREQELLRREAAILHKEQLLLQCRAAAAAAVTHHMTALRTSSTAPAAAAAAAAPLAWPSAGSKRPHHGEGDDGYVIWRRGVGGWASPSELSTAAASPSPTAASSPPSEDVYSPAAAATAERCSSGARDKMNLGNLLVA